MDLKIQRRELLKTQRFPYKAMQGEWKVLGTDHEFCVYTYIAYKVLIWTIRWTRLVNDWR